jgi:hypothetical protein
VGTSKSGTTLKQNSAPVLIGLIDCVIDENTSTVTTSKATNADSDTDANGDNINH